MYTINSSSLIFRIIFVMPPHPGGGSRPSAAAPRGLPGCGEAELSQENGPIKSFELIKHASDIQEPSKAFETATVLVAVVEHLASYAEQSLISAREQPENEACSRISDVCLYHNPSFSSRIFFISSASSLYFPVT